MLRSAAKNYKDVTVVCDPADYDTILAEIRGYGNTTPRLRLQALGQGIYPYRRVRCDDRYVHA